MGMRRVVQRGHEEEEDDECINGRDARYPNQQENLDMSAQCTVSVTQSAGKERHFERSIAIGRGQLPVAAASRVGGLPWCLCPPPPPPPPK